MKCRYIYCPAVAPKIGHRMTLMDRIRRRRALKRMETPDLFPVTGYCRPIYPGK